MSVVLQQPIKCMHVIDLYKTTSNEQYKLWEIFNILDTCI